MTYLPCRNDLRLESPLTATILISKTHFNARAMRPSILIVTFCASTSMLEIVCRFVLSARANSTCVIFVDFIEAELAVSA